MPKQSTFPDPNNLIFSDPIVQRRRQAETLVLVAGTIQEQVANLPDKVQITPTVMDRRKVITAHPKARAETTEKVEAETAEVEMTTISNASSGRPCAAMRRARTSAA